MRFCANASSIWMSSFDAMLFANLLLEDLAIEPALANQFLVRATLHDASFLQHQDLVRVVHRRKSLRDHERRAPFAQPPHGRLNQMLRRRIDARRCVVEDQDAWVHEERPGNGDSLPLPAAQRYSPLADHRVVTALEFRD